MATETLNLNKKPLRPHPAISTPDFGAANVLCSDPWDFVRLWLRRNKRKDAGFYWNQAAAFYRATELLPKLSAPLAAYYCFLNATKALLLIKSVKFTDRHGVSGYHIPGSRTALQNEIAIFHTGGVLPMLCHLMGQPVPKKEAHNLEHLLYNIPFVHRAFVLTYPNCTELFLPLTDLTFVRKVGSKESWIQGKVSAQYASAHFDRVLPSGWERDSGINDSIVVRRKGRFEWNGRQKLASVARLGGYHKHTRRHIAPIHSAKTRWYLRKKIADPRVIKRSQLAMVFAAMHRLSELTRYAPERLSKHLDGRQNWLIAEFLRMAPAQYIYSIASEMTGREFIRTSSYDLINTPSN